MSLCPSEPVPLATMTILAIQGFLEWFFVGLLVSLLGLVGLFSLYAISQVVRNPGRAPRRRS
jgi:hypothetical protein